MPSMGYFKDAGAYVEPVKLHLESIATGDSGVERNGDNFDVLRALDGAYAAAGEGRHQNFQSMKLYLEVDATGTLTATDTLDISINLQHAPEDTTTPDTPGVFVDVPAGTLLAAVHLGPGDITDLAMTQMVGGTNETLRFVVDVDLSRLERFVRVQYTPTFSNAADTAEVAMIGLLAGATILPVDASDK